MATVQSHACPMLAHGPIALPSCRGKAAMMWGCSVPLCSPSAEPWVSSVCGFDGRALWSLLCFFSLPRTVTLPHAPSHGSPCPIPWKRLPLPHPMEALIFLQQRRAPGSLRLWLAVPCAAFTWCSGPPRCSVLLWDDQAAPPASSWLAGGGDMWTLLPAAHPLSLDTLLTSVSHSLPYTST